MYPHPHRTLLRFMIAVTVLLIGAAPLAEIGCDRPADRAAQRPTIAVVVSGDTAGWITPCGCTSNQSGGMARRATYLDQLRQEHAAVLYLDCGGAVGGDGDGPYQLSKFKSILAGEHLLDVKAHNLGKSELAVGPAGLRALVEQSAAPFISANARDATTGELLVPPSTIVSRLHTRFLIVGVVSPTFATSEISVDDPRAAIVAAIAPHQRKYDRLIVLAYVSEDELGQLARDLPEADAIIGGPTHQPVKPRKSGPTLLASATNKGKFLVEMAIPDSPADSNFSVGSTRIVELDSSYADAPQQLANLGEYLAELKAADFTAQQSGFVSTRTRDAPPEFRIAGSAACAACHQQEQMIWSGSRHAHAWATLQAKGFHVDSYCQQCHTVGFGQPGGFVSAGRTPERGNVGCESCHGPSTAHVADPKKRTPWIAADQCIRCHDAENSPLFKSDEYWPRIVHGKGQQPTTTEDQR